MLPPDDPPDPEAALRKRARQLAAEVIDTAKLSGPIKFGATVALVDEETEEERTYRLVGEYEADIENGLLNIKSPLARALIGKGVGDSVEVRTPGGERSYEVVGVSYG